MAVHARIFLIFAMLACAIAIGVVGRVIALKGGDHLLTLIPPLRARCPSRRVHALLILGQSQGANTGTARMVARRPDSYMFRDGMCWHLQDPVIGPPEGGGSIWPAFANSYAKPVVISDLAISGSSIKQWTKPSQIAAVKAAIRAMQQQGYDPVIVWLHGETDAASEMAAEEYYEQMNILAAAIPNQRWFVPSASRCYDRQTKYLPLEEARKRFIADAPSRRKAGPDLDAISLELRRDDACHLNRDGQIAFGAMMGIAFSAAFDRHL